MRGVVLLTKRSKRTSRRTERAYSFVFLRHMTTRFLLGATESVQELFPCWCTGSSTNISHTSATENPSPYPAVHLV